MYRIKSAKIRSIVLAMGLTLAASAIFQISSYRNARRVEQIGNRDAHARDVLAALAALRSSAQDAVIGRNSYLLTGESRDLQSYRNAAARAAELLAQVRAITGDDPAQAQDARRLLPLVEAKLEDLKPAPPARRQQSSAMEARVDTEPDSRPAEQICRAVDRMIDEEQRVRVACLAQIRSVASGQARSLVVAGVYRVFVLLAGCTLILHQQARQRRIEQLCRQSEELFRNAFDHAATGMALANEEGRWLKANQALCELVGYAEDELLRSTSGSIMHPQDLEKERAAVEELRTGRVDRHQLEMRYIHKLGHPVWAVVTTSLVRDEKGRPQTLISQIQDVTERKRAEDQLRHQSLHDALTGLPNRLLLDDRLRRGIDRANQNSDVRLALLFLDLDRFKLINDSLGHAAGDQLLVTVAERLRRCVRGSDWVGENGFAAAADDQVGGGAGHTVARLGGDEFTVVLEGFRTHGDAERVAERILRELGRPVELGGHQIRAAASIGIVYAAAGRYTVPSQLLADADAALYRAKAAGRGGYAVFDAEVQESSLARLRLAC